MSTYKYICIALMLCFQTSMYSQFADKKLPTLVINEIHNENYLGGDVFIELLVLKVADIPYNEKSETPLIIVDDSNDQRGEPGFLSIKPECLAHVNQGDIIIIHGENTDITGLTDVLHFSINDSCIEKWEHIPAGNNSDYEDAQLIDAAAYNFKDYISFTGQGDLIQIIENEVYSNKVEQSQERNYSLISNNIVEYGPLAKSLGGPNNNLNEQLIDDVIGSSPLIIECTVVDQNDLFVGIIPSNNSLGTDFTYGPYTVSVEGRPDEDFVGLGHYLYDFECGAHTITVNDGKKSVSCEFHISSSSEDLIELVSCSGGPVNLMEELCVNLDSECISIKTGDNEPYTITGVHEMPSITPEYDNYPVSISFSDCKGGVTEELNFVISIVEPGMSCDDENSCTINDVYDGDCLCIGEDETEFEILDISFDKCSFSNRRLSVDKDYAYYTWKLNENYLADEKTIEIYEPGIYFLEVENESGCISEKQFEVANYDLSILPANPVFCGNVLTLELQNLPTNYLSIRWKFGDVVLGQDETFNVPGPGGYSATVLYENGCTITVEVEVEDQNDMDLAQILEENGFVCVPVNVLPSIKDGEDSSTRELSCEQINTIQSGEDIILNIEINGTTETIAAHEYLESLMTPFCGCKEEMGGLLMDDICEGFNLDFLLNYDKDFPDGVVIGYLLEGENGDPDCLYVKNSLSNPCAKIVENNKPKFLNILEDILCAHSKQEDLLLTVNIGEERDVYSGPIKLFDGHLYDGLNKYYKAGKINIKYEKGIHIGNYKLGETLTFTGIDAKTINEWCIRDSYFKGEGPAYQIKIPYNSCEDFLTITMDKVHESSFEWLFNSTEIVAQGTIVDAELDRIQSVPECFILDECEFLDKNSISFNNPDAKEVVLWLIDTQDPGKALEIVQCFDNNKLLKPYLDNVFKSSSEQVELLEGLSEAYFNGVIPAGIEFVNDDIDQYFMLEGERLVFFGDVYSSYPLEEQFYVKHEQRYPGTPLLALKNVGFFEYFESHLIYLDKEFNYTGKSAQPLFETGGHSERPVLFKIPGVHIAYSIAQWERGENVEDINLVANLVTIPFGWGQLKTAIKAKRLLSLIAGWGGVALGAGETLIPAANILLQETPICNDLGIEEFCEKYEEMVLYVDFVLLGGGFVANYSKKYILASISYKNLKEADRLAIKARMTPAEFTSWDNLMRAGANLLSSLDDHFPEIRAYIDANSNLPDVLKLIAENSPSANKLIDLENAIKNLDNYSGELGYKFVDDLIKSSNKVNGIGNAGNLAQMTEGQVKAWKVFNKHGDELATDVPTLTRMSDDLAANSELAAHLDDVINFTIWKEVKTLTNYGKHIDFIDARKALDANDFAKHMDGEIEIKIQNNLSQPVWSKKYGVNSFWDEFNADLASDPNILNHIQNNGTPSTSITGIHDLDNFNNLVSQGLADVPAGGLPAPLSGFNGMDVYKFKPRVKYPDWEDVKSTGVADLTKAKIKNKSNASTFWPSGFSKSDMKEYASAAVYEGKLANGGSLPGGLNSYNVTTLNSSVDNIAISQDLVTSFPYIP